MLVGYHKSLMIVLYLDNRTYLYLKGILIGCDAGECFCIMQTHLVVTYWLVTIIVRQLVRCRCVFKGYADTLRCLCWIGRNHLCYVVRTGIYIFSSLLVRYLYSIGSWIP